MILRETARAYIRIARNSILRFLGMRWQQRVTCLIKDSNDFGAVLLHTTESRPWWSQDRLVESKPIDWLEEDVAVEKWREIDHE